MKYRTLWNTVSIISDAGTPTLSTGAFPPGLVTRGQLFSPLWPTWLVQTPCRGQTCLLVLWTGQPRPLTYPVTKQAGHSTTTSFPPAEHPSDSTNLGTSEKNILRISFPPAQDLDATKQAGNRFPSPSGTPEPTAGGTSSSGVGLGGDRSLPAAE